VNLWQKLADWCVPERALRWTELTLGDKWTYTFYYGTLRFTPQRRQGRFR
jgi:hypothetical protein